MWLALVIQGVSKNVYNGIPNVTVWRMLRKCLHFKAYKPSIVQDVQRRIVCTPLSINMHIRLLVFSVYYGNECGSSSLSDVSNYVMIVADFRVFILFFSVIPFICNLY
jgi:hypothetical protein